MAKLEKDDVLRKVRALIDRADHSNTPEAEADACRKKADELMLVYAIESFELPTNDGKPRPQLREYRYGTTGDQKADDILTELFWTMAHHCGVKLGFYGWRYSKLVGYPADLDYLDLLFTSVRMDLSSKIMIRVDPEDTLENNVANLKAAGYKWAPIYDMLMEKGLVPPYSNGEFYRPKQDGGLTFRAYKRWLKDHPGEEHIGESPERYRRGFVKGYCNKIQSRLWNMSQNRKKAVEEKGYGIVLRNRTDELQEFLYEQFPDLRPHERGCTCQRCTAKEKPVRYREAGYSEAAARKGAKAGEIVNLSPGRNGLDRTERTLSSGG